MNERGRLLEENAFVLFLLHQFPLLLSSCIKD